MKYLVKSVASVLVILLVGSLGQMNPPSVSAMEGAAGEAKTSGDKPFPLMVGDSAPELTWTGGCRVDR